MQIHDLFAGMVTLRLVLVNTFEVFLSQIYKVNRAQIIDHKQQQISQCKELF